VGVITKLFPLKLTQEREVTKLTLTACPSGSEYAGKGIVKVPFMYMLPKDEARPPEKFGGELVTTMVKL
jgi:hypothetical protein